MKKITIICLAGLLVLCSGCQKVGYGRGAIRFSATTPSVSQTKAVWGEDVGDERSGIQRIVWRTNDEITLKSNLAKTAEGQDSYVYTVTNADPAQNGNPAYSYGKLTPAGSDGLLWDENYLKQEHEFWAVYPSLPIGNGGTISANIPGDGLVMVSHVAAVPISSQEERDAAASVYTQRNQTGSTVTLYFYPAFTTVKFKLENATGQQITANSITLSHADRPLQGDFTATISDTGVTGLTSSSTIRSASVNVGWTLANETEMNVYSDPIFLLPQTYRNVRLTVNYTAGGETVEKSMVIAETLQAGMQYRLTGLVLPEELKLIDFEVISVGQDINNIDLGGASWE